MRHRSNILYTHYYHYYHYKLALFLLQIENRIKTPKWRDSGREKTGENTG